MDSIKSEVVRREENMNNTIQFQVKKKLNFYVIMLCGIYTLLTLISSSMQLIQGIESDTNIHILMRFVVCFIGISFWVTFSLIKFKKQWLTVLVQYMISMSLIFAIVFVSGYFVELADSAYLNIFMNYTIPFAIISTIVSIHKQKKNKKEIN